MKPAALFISLAAIVVLVLSCAGAGAQTYRPLYHFTTDSNWINDPNGLFYYRGQYHLFCQYNPYGDKWGHMSWAHATSTDLFNWKQQPLAIKETENKDSSVTMIFSGSAAVDSFNTSGFAKAGAMPLVAMYTGHVVKNGKELVQHQNLAYSVDGGINWQQYAGNPVLDIQAKDFRDPKIFWYAPGKKWVMVVAKPDQYKVMLYESKNLQQWHYLSDFGGMGNVQSIWECPDLFEVPVEGSREKKWVLTVSAGHPQKDYLGMQYFVGSFDGKQFTVIPQEYPLYVDYGKDYYAGISFNNLPATDGRSIMIGWANDWRYAGDIPTQGFRSLYAVPRKLQLRKTGNVYYLLQMPVQELDTYTEKIHLPQNISLNNEEKVFNTNGNALKITFDLSVEAGAQAGIAVLKSGEEQTLVTFDKNRNNITLDRTHSGRTDFNRSFPGADSVAFRQPHAVWHVTILVDVCVVEVFVNNGEYTLTNLVFPAKQEGSIALFAGHGKAVFTGLSAKHVKKTLH